MKNYYSYDIGKIYKSSQTVFTLKEVALIWKTNKFELVKARVNDYVRKGKLFHIRRGIYAKDENYDKFELATKIYTPSYISLETVLFKEGIIFQYYSDIFVVSYLSREIKVDRVKIRLRKIKDIVLTDTLGIKKEKNYFIATKERAFLDALYLYGDYYFDNLDQINKDKVLELSRIYRNKQLNKRLKKIFNA